MGAGVIAKETGSRRRRGRGRARPMAEINVTPMVDVMLVLLIIFMVAAPLLTVGVPVELPRTAAEALPMEGRRLEERMRTERQHPLGPPAYKAHEGADLFSQ